MPIKAKPVDAKRVAEVARGYLSSSMVPPEGHGGKNSFYYDDARRKAELDMEDDASSASSSSTGTYNRSASVFKRDTTVGEVPLRAATAPARAHGDTSDSDEEVLAEARARTRKFLYLDSEANYVALPYRNDRLAAYERRKQEKDAERLSMEVSTPTVVPDGAHVDAPVHEEQIIYTEGSDASLSTRSSAHDIPEKSASFLIVSNDTYGATDDKTVSMGDPTNVGATYRPPPRNFAELQAAALQDLYDEWCNAEADTVEWSAEKKKVFVASDYTTTAFTLAVTAAANSQHRVLDGGHANGLSIVDAPFSIEELASAETNFRNAKRRWELYGDTSADFISPQRIAEESQQKLDTFMQSVTWLERLVRDQRFVRSVASFLYKHHRVFLPHFEQASSRLTGVCRRNDDDMREHAHEEYSVYEDFGERVSAVIVDLLSTKVKGFEEAEFVEALFDTPVGPGDRADDANGGSEATAREKVKTMADVADGYADTAGPQNILSYPAWRIILALSDFHSFFDWMLDYIQEEYNVPSDTDSKNVTVAGTRSLRALIDSTYKDNRDFSGRRMPVSPSPHGRIVVNSPVTSLQLSPTEGAQILFSSDASAPPDIAPLAPSGETVPEPTCQSRQAHSAGDISSSAALPSHRWSGASMTSGPSIALFGSAHVIGSPPPSQPTVARPKRLFPPSTRGELPSRKKPSAVAGRNLPPLPTDSPTVTPLNNVSPPFSQTQRASLPGHRFVTGGTKPKLRGASKAKVQGKGENTQRRPNSSRSASASGRS